MIVWLASYPRCGNTLLRQILKHCFDKESWENAETAEAWSPEFRREYDGSRPVWEMWGHRPCGENFQAFYEDATCSDRVILVKTHEPPVDDQDAIYVVRDGRLALESFLAFQEHHHPGSSTFVSLLCGDHAYGGWSDHYRSWQERPAGRTLVVRFEELVDANPLLLARLAKFIHHEGNIRPWRNPQARLQQALPAFFRSGRSQWSPGRPWTDFYLRLFFSLHGSTMAELGYASPEEVGEFTFPEGSDERHVVDFVSELTKRSWKLQRDCDARLKIIHQLEQARVLRLRAYARAA